MKGYQRIYACMMTAVLAGCSTSVTGEAAGTSEAVQTSEVQSEIHVLTAYFSRAGENYNVGTVEKGNTALVAEMIHDQVQGDLYEIQTVETYPESYDEMLPIAEDEKNNNARPELNGTVNDFASYDVIYLGYPIWWGDMPMAVYTFLESYDFTGKMIVPFCTNEGSGLASTVESIQSVCPGAVVKDGLSIKGTDAQAQDTEAVQAVQDWLAELDLSNWY